ncbi:MAG: diapophytoene dehydrogenase [Armatimonadetes bacterium Cent15-Ar3]|nr:MAG: diapophytoene dehydrogenase [Armatimonadetes bacterium Cent15-Ar3]
MRVEILMPELGESVHEGTVSRWLKQVGDTVKEDEPVVEIMTDKVNTELGAPSAGVLAEIVIGEGAPVKVFEAMGFIETDASAAVSAPAAKKEEPKVESAAPTQAEQPTTIAQPASGEKRWYTPLVRAIAKDNNVSDAQLASISGTGEGGRVTKKDLEAYLAGGAPKTAAAPTAKAPEFKAPAPMVAGPDQEVTPLAGMRKMIADHMIRSSQVPTVSTITEVDVTNMVHFRDKNKETFLETYGVKLTYTPFFIKALTEALVEFPLMNAALMPDNNIVKTKGVHMGVAVALGAKGEGGLIVPVIRDCQAKSLIDIARDLDGIAKKARSNSLSVADVQGGTFTLTNPGTYGALFGTPMINAPQAGILGVYAIKKTPVIIDDMIAIRSIMHLVLTYDHRLIDGMLAGAFLASVRDKLAKFDFFK